eukprot:TRINITY_DN18151_c0_g1_i1.p2 TRINITY_DN18151_c0_g1~~TRINITY_DN18151_c0_g1_i1.p2  ORF type:complete len:127 (+),score=8.22 TRINITY_DN18151_c0_g1_i1:57-437(+)
MITRVCGIATRRTAVSGQARTCLTQMYGDNYSRIPAKDSHMKRDIRPLTRSKVRGTDQKWDPDWEYTPHGLKVAGVIGELYQEDAKERILTYKLERMDYEVREVPVGTAPPPPTREVTRNITLDML